MHFSHFPQILILPTDTPPFAAEREQPRRGPCPNGQQIFGLLR
jgi:hypothetical protein